MEFYFRLVDGTLQKYKVPQKLIREHVHELSNQIQIMLSSIEEFQPRSKVQKLHVSRAKEAIRKAAAIMHRIQNLAQIEIDGAEQDRK